MPTETSQISFVLNGQPARAPAACTVAVAVLANGVKCFRRSISREERSPLCGMGICFECRLSIDGRPHQKSCQILLAPGMVVKTDD
jgi:sarcosine oxidase subunit alpha